MKKGMLALGLSIVCAGASGTRVHDWLTDETRQCGTFGHFLSMGGPQQVLRRLGWLSKEDLTDAFLRPFYKEAYDNESLERMPFPHARGIKPEEFTYASMQNLAPMFAPRWAWAVAHTLVPFMPSWQETMRAGKGFFVPCRKQFVHILLPFVASVNFEYVMGLVRRGVPCENIDPFYIGVRRKYEGLVRVFHRKIDDKGWSVQKTAVLATAIGEIQGWEDLRSLLGNPVLLRCIEDIIKDLIKLPLKGVGTIWPLLSHKRIKHLLKHEPDEGFFLFKEEPDRAVERLSLVEKIYSLSETSYLPAPWLLSSPERTLRVLLEWRESRGYGALSTWEWVTLALDKRVPHKEIERALRAAEGTF